MPSTSNPYANNRSTLCKAYHAGDYGAPGQFGVGNQTHADLKKYAR